MDLRIAGPNDWTEIAALHAASWRNSHRGILSDAYLDGQVLSERIGVWRGCFRAAPANQYVVVAEDQSVVVGFGCAYGNEDDQLGTKLDNPHVLPTQKRRGIGTMMIENIASWSSENHPGKGVFLWVFERNLPARQFYERLAGIIAGDTIWTARDGTAVKSLLYVWKDADIDPIRKERI
jgi:ribosomal protein S18 acetylase RimI-like enzyme